MSSPPGHVYGRSTSEPKGYPMIQAFQRPLRRFFSYLRSVFSGSSSNCHNYSQAVQTASASVDSEQLKNGPTQPQKSTSCPTEIAMPFFASSNTNEEVSADITSSPLSLTQAAVMFTPVAECYFATDDASTPTSSRQHRRPSSRSTWQDWEDMNGEVSSQPDSDSSCGDPEGFSRSYSVGHRPRSASFHWETGEWAIKLSTRMTHGGKKLVSTASLSPRGVRRSCSLRRQTSLKRKQNMYSVSVEPSTCAPTRCMSKLNVTEVHSSDDSEPPLT